MILPEHIIRIRLQRSIDAINADKDRKFIRSLFKVENDFTDKELSPEYKKFYPDDPGISELSGLEQQAVDWWEKKPPIVDLCLNWAMIETPGIHIDYGSESGEGFIGQSLTVEESKDFEGVNLRVGDVYSVPSTVLWIMTENKEYTLLLYYIVKALIQFDWLWYARHGLQNLQISGGNVDRAMMLLPNVGYFRQLTLKYQYNCWVNRELEVPEGESFEVINE